MLAVDNYSRTLGSSPLLIDALVGASSFDGDGINSTFDNPNNEIDILQTGTYEISYKCNCKSNTSGHTFTTDVYNKVGNTSQGLESNHYFNNTNEYSHNNMSFIRSLTSGARLSLYGSVSPSSGSTNINDCNIRLKVVRLK
jgi:hypothetical protein